VQVQEVGLDLYLLANPCLLLHATAFQPALPCLDCIASVRAVIGLLIVRSHHAPRMRLGLGWDGKDTKLGRVKSRRQVDERSRMSQWEKRTRGKKKREIEVPYLDWR